MKKRFLIFIVLPTLLVLSGCSNTDNTTQISDNEAIEHLSDIDTNTTSVSGTTSDLDKNFEENYSESYIATGGDIAILTDTSYIFDKSYLESIYDGVSKYAYSSGKTFSYYAPKDDSQKSYEDNLLLAIDTHANLIVTAGPNYNEILGKYQEKYPNIFFLMIDGVPTTQNKEIDIRKNVHCISFDEYTSGYISGYITSLEGYKHFGFIGGKNVATINEYCYGFVNGINDYAKENSIADEYQLKINYCNSFIPNDSIYEKSLDWYNNDTDIIFSCGGGIYESIIKAANETDKKVIGVDINQNSYDETILTSAAKGVDIGVINALDSFFANNGWDENSAGIATECGTEIWCASIPTDEDTWKFVNVSLEDYMNFYISIRSNERVLPENTHELPQTLINIVIDDEVSNEKDN